MSQQAEFIYQGTKLEHLQHALNWKNYHCGQMKDYVGGDMLEVVAGLGGTTKILADESRNRWTCLEPDPKLAEIVRSRAKEGDLPLSLPMSISAIENSTPFFLSTFRNISTTTGSRTISLLEEAGLLIVLGPAHQRLFSPYDKKLAISVVTIIGRRWYPIRASNAKRCGIWTAWVCRLRWPVAPF